MHLGRKVDLLIVVTEHLVNLIWKQVRLEYAKAEIDLVSGFTV